MNFKIALEFEDGSEIYSILLEQIPSEDKINDAMEFYGAKSYRIVNVPQITNIG